ncbi:hypothetical protein CFC21_095925 [Triticum aestivum]|uniref:Uncharacterized protein n=3 Tax=Triticum TaxID=4564 RepID=A0A9R0Z2A6_TRITD|nr:hypothetical protein CFC21_095925 [Triticum aestivum]VAI69992.1 unnamed protein product [Triticum turgidum subsp. durum]
MVCAPERMTRSSASRPLTTKLSTSSLRLDVGGTRNLTDSEALEKVPSRRPDGTSKSTLPPLRMQDASRAEKAMMSAQETTPGQAASRASLMASISSKPRREGLLGALSFSGVGLNGVGSRRTEASQP